MWQVLGTVIGVFIVLGIWSLAMWGTSPISRMVENLFVGVTTGYGIVVGLSYLNRTAFAPILSGNVIRIVPVLLGLLLYARYVPRYAWLTRYPLAILSAMGIGLALKTTINVNVIKQISSTVLSVVNAQTPIDILNSLLIAVFTIATLLYFVFNSTVETTIRPIRHVARFAMFVAFGSAFAGALTYRANLHIGRQMFLWAPENQMITFGVAAIMIVVLIANSTLRKSDTK